MTRPRCPRDIVKLTIDGGADNDILTGSQGADVLRGGDGSDVITGGRGDGLGRVWATATTHSSGTPGDGSDIVEGEAGFDTMAFNGADIDESFDISANGARLRLFRDAGVVTMDAAGVEQVNLATLGGADTVTVNDLTGIGVDRSPSISRRLAGGGDGHSGHRYRQRPARNDTCTCKQRRVGRRQRMGGKDDSQRLSTPVSTPSSSTA